MDTHSTYGGPRRRGERGNGQSLEKIVDDKFPNLGKEIDIQIQEVQGLIKMNPRRPTPRHIIIKIAEANDEEKILKASRVSILLHTRERS